MKYSIATNTEAYKRVCEIGGFSISKLDIRKQLISFNFTCSCGRKESLQAYFNEYTTTLFTSTSYDAAQLLEAVGANSARHLIEDGYTDEEIVNLRRGYNETIENVKRIRSKIVVDSFTS